MPQLRVRPRGTRGLVAEVTPESAGWTYVGFALHRVAVGESVAAETGTREVCLVLVSGKARLTIDGKDFGEIGERMSPFDGAPWAAYAPAGSRYALTATTALELGVCSAPGGAGFPAKLIPPGAHPQIARGKGSNTRYVTNIMPEDDGSANALLVVEVITPGGNTSSYPPHKHDQDDLPDRELPRGDVLSPLQPAPGLRLPARLYRRPFARRSGPRRGRRCGDGAERLSPGRHPARL